MPFYFSLFLFQLPCFLFEIPLTPHESQSFTSLILSESLEDRWGKSSSNFITTPLSSLQFYFKNFEKYRNSRNKNKYSYSSFPELSTVNVLAYSFLYYFFPVDAFILHQWYMNVNFLKMYRIIQEMKLSHALKAQLDPLPLFQI